MQLSRRAGKIKPDAGAGSRMMPKVGVEPTLPEENYALNVARLPIPPLRHELDPEYRNLLPPCQGLQKKLQGNCISLFTLPPPQTPPQK